MTSLLPVFVEKNNEPRSGRECRGPIGVLDDAAVVGLALGAMQYRYRCVLTTRLVVE